MTWAVAARLAGMEREALPECLAALHIVRIIVERFGKRYNSSSLSGVLRRLGFSRQKTRPATPH